MFSPQTEALIGLYAAQSSHMKYRREDYNSDSADIKRYAVKEPNTVVLDYNGKTQLLGAGSQGEVDFTAALLKLESDRVPLVCWAIGDGERDLKDINQSTGYSSVADTLAKNNFATRDVLLSQVTSIPSDCTLVAIVDPTTELAAPSVKAVAEYLSAGGKLLVAAEPWAKDAKSIDSLNAVLTPYGAGFSGALVIEADPSRRSSSDPTILAVTTYGRSPITNDIQGHVSFFPVGAKRRFETHPHRHRGHCRLRGEPHDAAHQQRRQPRAGPGLVPVAGRAGFADLDTAESRARAAACPHPAGPKHSDLRHHGAHAGPDRVRRGDGLVAPPRVQLMVRIQFRSAPLFSRLGFVER